MKIRSLSAVLLLLSMVFTSCLKSKDATGILEDDNGSLVVEIEDVAINNFYASSTDLAFKDTPPQETVNIFNLKYHQGRKSPAGDVRVKVAATTNNLPAGTIPLPAANFTIPSEITIPRSAERTVPFPLTIKKAGLSLTETYALTFVISEVSEGVISEIGKEITVTFIIKNKYDGAYTMTGTLTDLAAPTITAKSPQKVHLITTGPNSVYLHNFGTAVANWKDLFPILSAGAESAYGSFTPEFIFDANNNVVDVVNAYGLPANGRSAALDPSGVNKWDPATRNLKVKWFMYQPAPTLRTSFDFTFTFTGER